MFAFFCNFFGCPGRVGSETLQGGGLQRCAGCLVVITDYGPRAEAARALGHELLVDNGEGRLEGLEEERQKREEKEVGEERQPTHTTHR